MPSLQELLSELERPILSIDRLTALLCAPLAALSLLPGGNVWANPDPLPHGAQVLRAIPRIQRALLFSIVPTWIPSATASHISLIEAFFCPAGRSKSSCDVALLAYPALLSTPPITTFSARMLVRLTREYDMHKLFIHLHFTRTSSEATLSWEEYVRNLAAVPSKVANALAADGKIPSDLDNLQETYFNTLSTQFEQLLFDISETKRPQGEHVLEALAYTWTKFTNIGIVTIVRSSNQPSFFATVFSTISQRHSVYYSRLWTDLINELPSITCKSSIESLLSCLDSRILTPLSPEVLIRSKVVHQSSLLFQILGQFGPDLDQRLDVWDAAASAIVDLTWPEYIGRVAVCWFSGGTSVFDTPSMERLLSKITDIWTSPSHIKHSLLSRHRYLTLLLLLSISHFDKKAIPILSLAWSPIFIQSISEYINHLDMSVRLCGLLVAEVVADMSGQTLSFGGWEEGGDDRKWYRDIRVLLEHSDRSVTTEADLVEDPPKADSMPQAVPTAPTKVSRIRVRKPEAGYDSDDSLNGYVSPGSSTRSSSPTPSELSELEKDPTLRNPNKKVIRKPVYLYELSQLLKPAGSGLGKETGQEEADRMAMGLQSANDLIRRKKNFGMELEENAVNLAHAFIGLQDTFELDDFDRLRQSALTALVASCPKKSAPAMIEQFFSTQYSVMQRFAMLNALAIGARELAGLDVPPPSGDISFPSRQLPSALHQKYITQSDQDGSQVQSMVQGISRLAIEKGRDSAAADTIPDMVRERHLRIRKPAKVSPLPQQPPSMKEPNTTRGIVEATFKDLAAEYFIGPLLSHFWLFVSDENLRESRSLQSRKAGYKGTGTGMVLNPLVLSHFLGTFAVLTHAARNSPAYLAVLGPRTLELALTLGTRPTATEAAIASEEEKRAKEASVLRGCLELALVVLDACLELDDGKSLGLDHTVLVMAVGEWAGKVFNAVESGVKIEGGGGLEADRIRRASAAIVIKMEELTSKWRRSMIMS